MNSINDFTILTSIIDEKDNTKGTVLSNGTTIKEIQSKTNLSYTKIRQVILDMNKEELIERGLNKRTAKTYIITNKGLKILLKFKGVNY